MWIDVCFHTANKSMITVVLDGEYPVSIDPRAFT